MNAKTSPSAAASSFAFKSSPAFTKIAPPRSIAVFALIVPLVFVPFISLMVYSVSASSPVTVNSPLLMASLVTSNSLSPGVTSIFVAFSPAGQRTVIELDVTSFSSSIGLKICSASVVAEMVLHLDSDNWFPIALIRKKYSVSPSNPVTV